MLAARSIIELFGCIVVAALACGCEDSNMRSSSMSPTIAQGEKVTIDYSAYAISQPKRWDVVAFEPPSGSNETWLFRVVALPGERVEFASNGIAVNGRPLALPAKLTNISYLSMDAMTAVIWVRFQRPTSWGASEASERAFALFHHAIRIVSPPSIVNVSPVM